MIIKVKPDLKKAESLVKMAESRIKSVSLLDARQFSTIVAEMYYEIIKEFSSALILIDGFKSVGENSHRDLFDFLSTYKLFSEDEIIFIHDLRVKRNRSSYEGRDIEYSYLKLKQNKINKIIKDLKEIINNKLK